MPATQPPSGGGGGGATGGATYTLPGSSGSVNGRGTPRPTFRLPEFSAAAVVGCQFAAPCFSGGNTVAFL